MIEIVFEDVIYEDNRIVISDIWLYLLNESLKNNITNNKECFNSMLNKESKVYDLTKEEELMSNRRLFEVNIFLNKNNTFNTIRLEVNRITGYSNNIIKEDNTIYLIDKDVYLDTDLHLDHKLKYVIGKVGFYIDEIERHDKFENIFESIWNRYLGTL